MFKIKAADGTNNLCGRRIAQIRKAKKLSQRKLAVKMQLLGFVTDIDLVIFSRALDVPITELLSAEDAQL